MIPDPSGKILFDTNPEELYNNLNGEILRLIIKGTHQLIKNLYIIKDNNMLTDEILRQDIAVLKKYKLLNIE